MFLCGLEPNNEERQNGASKKAGRGWGYGGDQGQGLFFWLLFSLQSRRFLTKTRRYIDRGRHLEKQRKRLRGRGGGRGEGRGGERRKRLPAKPMKLSNAP